MRNTRLRCIVLQVLGQDLPVRDCMVEALHKCCLVVVKQWVPTSRAQGRTHHDIQLNCAALCFAMLCVIANRITRPEPFWLTAALLVIVHALSTWLHFASITFAGMSLFVGSLLPRIDEVTSLCVNADGELVEAVPLEFLQSQSVVVEMTSRNVWPRRSWGDDVVEVDITDGLVNFRSGLSGPTPESLFQGTAPRLSHRGELEMKEKIVRGDIVNIRELLPASFDITYRWKNHTLESEDIYNFRWVHRTFTEVGCNTGCYESGDYRVYSAENRHWSDLRAMQVIMCVTRVKLCNTRRRISPSQAVLVQPIIR